MKIIIALLVLASSVGCALETKHELIKANSIGSITIGMTINEIKSLDGVNIAKTVVIRERESPAFNITYPIGNEVTIEEENGVIWSIRTKSPNFRTNNDAFVGQSVQEVLELHPESKLLAGTEEGGYLSVYIPSIGGYFHFNLEGVSYEWLKDITNHKSKILDSKSIQFVISD